MSKDLRTERSRESVMRNTAIGFVIGMLLGGLVDVISGDFGIASILGMLLGSLFGYYGLQNIYLMEYPRQTVLQLATAVILFFATLFTAYYLIERVSNLFVLSILPFIPVLPGIFLVVSIGMAFSKLDELQRRIQLEAIAIGFGITAIGALTYGLWGLMSGQQANWILVTVLLVFSWLLGKLITRWKYR